MATLTQLKKPSPAGAKKFFNAKNSFTTGPVEVWHTIDEGQDVNIIDVREAHDFRTAHVPNALNLPREQWHNTEALFKDKANIVYCYSQTCHLAAKACEEFASRGFPVMEMEGGFAAWQKYNLKTET
ncbi:MAG TPA: rhodanese-like domain-containing protein [Verrucomicrobiae bacterium]|jgi:rhodanese-related sulfurtransferase|nr:rhodanese-like domain-containing protein [Verrucomicrobiae bacterium]